MQAMARLDVYHDDQIVGYLTVANQTHDEWVATAELWGGISAVQLFGMEIRCEVRMDVRSFDLHVTDAQLDDMCNRMRDFHVTHPDIFFGRRLPQNRTVPSPATVSLYEHKNPVQDFLRPVTRKLLA